MKSIEQNLTILLKKALVELRCQADDISISLSPNCRVAEVKFKSTESKIEVLLLERPKNEIRCCLGFALSVGTASFSIIPRTDTTSSFTAVPLESLLRHEEGGTPMLLSASMSSA